MEHVIGIQFLTKLEDRIPCQGQPKSSVDHLLRRIQDGTSWPVDLTGPLVNPQSRLDTHGPLLAEANKCSF